jgi:hypothetical protein
MFFNFQKHCDTHPHTIDIHCDASETHWELINLDNGFTVRYMRLQRSNLRKRD